VSVSYAATKCKVSVVVACNQMNNICGGCLDDRLILRLMDAASAQTGNVTCVAGREIAACALVAVKTLSVAVAKFSVDLSCNSSLERCRCKV
jgi:hypothetical protein